MRVKLTIAAIVLTVITTGLLAPSMAAAADTSTQVPMTCTTSFGPPITGHFTVTMSAPDSIAPGATSTVHFDVALGEFFDIPAPFAGTIDAQFGLSASNATPATFTLAIPPTHFDAGDSMPKVSFDQPLTATGSPGSAISVEFLSFGYTIVPDSGGNLSVSCLPDVSTSLGSIPIETPTPTTPQSKDDCKNGGWQQLADATGAPFKNQGQCVRTTVGTPKT
jgi:hypothetical protein